MGVNTLKKRWVCILASGILASCASIVSKSQWPVNITSTPEGCVVKVFDKKGMQIFKGTTPTVITLKSSDGFFSGADYTVVFEKEGYEPLKMNLFSELNPWYIGNIAIGGLIGFLIVDPATGAMFRLPEHLHGELTAKTSFIKPGESGVFVATVDQVPVELRYHLERIR